MPSTEFGSSCKYPQCQCDEQQGFCEEREQFLRDRAAAGLIPKRKRRAKKAKITREDDVEADFVKQKSHAGKLVLKVKVVGRPGYPDRLVLGDLDQAVEQARHEFGPELVMLAPEAGNLHDSIQRIIAAAFYWAELKKTKRSPFQPKQKTVIPALRKRGFRVDVVTGE